MSQMLERGFVEGRLSVLAFVPDDWDVEPSQFFKLDLKMCRLKSVMYGFNWGAESYQSDRFKKVIEMPGRVLSLDLSLNELSSLDHTFLSPLSHLRAVDASLNKIDNVVGIEVLPELRTLNLAHNAMQRVDQIPRCGLLTYLNLSLNQLETVTEFPHLKNLSVLHLNNNKLTSIEGLQRLGRLKELYVQGNYVTDLIPLSSCLKLVTLNASNNRIDTLNSVIDVLGRLKHLRVLSLQGNPVERSPGYQSMLLEGTSIVSLDCVTVKPYPKHTKPAPVLSEGILTIKDLTNQVYEDQIQAERNKMEESVHFLQARILAIQKDFNEYENKMRSDLDLCIHHLDSLSSSQLAKFDSNHVRGLLTTPPQKPWQQEEIKVHIPRQHVPQESKTDYKHVTNTDEVLRLAYLELSKGKTDPRYL